MNDDLGNIHYSPIQDYQYEHWFREVQYNGKELNNAQREEYLKRVDGYISQHLEGLPLMKKILDSIKDKHDEFHEIQRTIVSVSQFCLITMIDSMVLGKYFILANKDYDRRLMRGKLRVVLNEGFKKLYGFNDKNRGNSEWKKLASVLKYFPEEINHQYNHLSSLLAEHSKSSSWWRDERNIETHLDTEKLYDSRCEDIIESKVMMESLKLYNTLYAVNSFLFNMHSCINNFCVDKYRRGELKEE
jgi:hypothetical protein